METNTIMFFQYLASVAFFGLGILGLALIIDKAYTKAKMKNERRRDNNIYRKRGLPKSLL